jgi:hypothetical protein
MSRTPILAIELKSLMVAESLSLRTQETQHSTSLYQRFW